MTCKDCIHYDVCSKLCRGIDMNLFMKDDNTTASESCTDFKDKTKYIDLPCKVGDKVYYIGGIHGKLIKDATVIEITTNGDGFAYRVERNGMYFDLQQEETYYTREEAETALKEK